MLSNHETQIRLLEAEFTRRKSANPRYSLRAFAKAMGVPPGRVSELLSGKRRPTPALAAKISNKLGLSPAQSRVLTNAAPEAGYSSLSEDSFALISDSYHTTFLSLIETRGFRSDAMWIAGKLRISTVEARAMLHRLERLGLIENRRGRYVKIADGLKTTTDVPNAALKRSHRQSILQAAEALETVPTAERDVTSITMAIDPRKLPAAKALIREFRFRLADLLESGDRTEVYNLNVQLVPATPKEIE